MSIALAREGGLSFIYCSQSIASQTEMICNIKKFKAGFVLSDSNVSINATLNDVIKTIKKTGHSTVAVTDDGSNSGKFLGLVTDRDFRLKDSPDTPVDKIMTRIDNIKYVFDNITNKEANDIIYKNKIDCLPILSQDLKLKFLVFRKDYEDYEENPNSMLDKNNSFMVGTAVNTKDYQERIPALIDAGADILCIDSSDGFSEWQKDVIEFVKNKYDSKIKIGAGNVVTTDAFNYLVNAGADFIKVGIGGGSICITREQKGIGRGQASALIDIVNERNKHLEKYSEYIPICSDGGIVLDNNILIALALGADFVMMGRYFARFDESPSQKMAINNIYYKEYWAEGSNRAKNWERYDMGENKNLSFEEGVDAYIPYAGKLKDNIKLTINKIKSTMCNVGALSLKELYEKSRLTIVSSTSIIEGGYHDVFFKNSRF
jgi:IMP dehydrogenase